MRWRMTAAATAMLGGLAVLLTGVPAESASEQLVLAGNGSHGLIISGTPFNNLHPGAVRRIKVTFTNPNRFAIKVIGAKGELTRTSKRGCKVSATNLVIRPYQGKLPLSLPPNSRRSTGHIEVYMPNSVSPACQLTVFTVKLTGMATR